MADIPTPLKPVESDFLPSDMNVRRTMLDQSVAGAQQRWYQLELERMSRELTLAQAKKGDLRASKFRATAGTELTAQIDQRMAQILGDQQQLENEIKVYTEALAKLPKDE